MRVEQIKKFAIVPREFSLEEGEVTPTLKLRRRVIHDHFAAEIETALRGLAATEFASRRSTRREYAAGETLDPHDRPGVRGVDELVVADVDADVAEPGEEDEISRLELRPRSERSAGSCTATTL